jgi:HK97 family phage major capsid protein
MPQKMLRALETFHCDNGSAGPIEIRKGSLVADTHELVAQHPTYFEPAEDLLARSVRNGNVEHGTDRNKNRHRTDRAHRVDDLDGTALPGVRQTRDSALRAIERMGYLSPEAGDRLVDVVERDRSGADSRYLEAVSREEYRTAFMRRLTRPNSAPFEMGEGEAKAMRDVANAELERAALSVGSGTLPLPAAIDPSVNLTSNGAINPIRQLASVVPITNSEWHGVTSAGTTATFAAELTTVADGTPTMALPIIKPEKAQMFAQWSLEAAADWVTLEQELAKLFADAKDVVEAQMFVSGTGVNQPQGLIAGATGTVAAGTASFVVANIYSLQQSLAPRFSGSAQWISSLTHANNSWKFIAAGDTTNARIWNDDRTKLLGKSWNEVSSMSAVLTAGARVMAYGDIHSAYKIVDRLGLSIVPVPLVLDTTTNLPTGATGAYAYFRVGAGVINQAAAKVLVTT